MIFFAVRALQLDLVAQLLERLSRVSEQCCSGGVQLLQLCDVLFGRRCADLTHLVDDAGHAASYLRYVADDVGTPLRCWREVVNDVLVGENSLVRSYWTFFFLVPSVVRRRTCWLVFFFGLRGRSANALTNSAAVLAASPARRPT